MSNETKTEAMTAERLDLIRKRSAALLPEAERDPPFGWRYWVQQVCGDDVPALIAALKEAPEREAIRWQQRLHALEGVREQDASGNESGDPLDYTADCVRKALDALNEELTDMAADLEGLKGALAEAELERDEAMAMSAESALKYTKEEREHWARVDAAEKERDVARAQVKHLLDGLSAIEVAGVASDRERAALRARVVELEEALDRDKTGLAHALGEIQRVLKGYAWIQAGEWASYSHEDRTAETMRAEAAWALEEVEKFATDALKASGALAQQALCPPAAPPEQASTLQDPKP